MADKDTIKKYEAKLDSLLSEYKPLVKTLESRGPSEVLPYLFLGDFGDATSHGQLTDMGITHLLNCAAVSTNVINNIMNSFCANNPARRYQQLEADDDEEYPMLQHADEACEFIDDARRNGGKCMVYCVRGVNRSAALCIAYLVAYDRKKLTDAVKETATARGKVLTNESFRTQLINFAAEKELLG